MGSLVSNESLFIENKDLNNVKPEIILSAAAF